jgi:putative metal-binding protein
MISERSRNVARAAAVLLAVLAAACSGGGGGDECTQRVWSYDADGDGYRGCNHEPVTACDAPSAAPATCPGCPPSGWTAGDDALPCGDCDDGLAATHPGVADVCDHVDNDCNGSVDPGCACYGSETRPCGPSTDAGECAFGVQACVANAWADCVGAVLPADEVCDGLDNDCDGVVDDGCDDDDDNSCDASMTIVGTPPTCTAGGGDCDDLEKVIHPGMAESCDDQDTDCDGVVDEGCDDDGDDYCDRGLQFFGVPTSACPNGGGDCNDADASVHPGATETCDGRDDDCNFVVDDAAWKFGGAAAQSACYAAIPVPYSLGTFYLDSYSGPTEGDGDFNGHSATFATKWLFEVVSNRLEANINLTARETVSDWTQIFGMGKRAALPSAYDGKIVEVLGIEQDGGWEPTSICGGSYTVPNFPNFTGWHVILTTSYGVQTVARFPSCDLMLLFSCTPNFPGDDWGQARCTFGRYPSGESYIWVRRVP